MKQLLCALSVVLMLIMSTQADAGRCRRSSVLYRTGTSSYNIQSEYTIEEILVKTVASARDRLNLRDKLRDKMDDVDIRELAGRAAQYYLAKKLSGEEVTLRGVVSDLGVGDNLNLKFNGLYINDERVEVNKENIVKAVMMIAGFILDTETEGSVSYSYSFTYQGLPVTRLAYIVNDSVYLNTEVHGGLPAPVCSAKIQVWATENDRGTLIQTRLTVVAKDKPRIFNGLANRIVASETGKFHGRGFGRARGFINSSERGDRSARLATSIIDALREGGFRTFIR